MTRVGSEIHRPARLIRHTIGTQRKRESPSMDSPIFVKRYRRTTSQVGTAGFEPATP